MSEVQETSEDWTGRFINLDTDNICTGIKVTVLSQNISALRAYQNACRTFNLHVGLSRHMQAYQDICRPIKTYVSLSRYMYMYAYQDTCTCRPINIQVGLSRHIYTYQGTCRPVKDKSSELFSKWHSWQKVWSPWSF